MDEDLREKIRKLEKRVRAIEDFLESFPSFRRQPNYEEGEDLDELYEDAVMIVIQHEKCSASLIQRRLQVGFNRAARILEQLEANGIVSPAVGSEPRDVLITAKDLENLKEKLLKREEKKRKN